VKSGVIRMIRKENTLLDCDIKLFKTVVKTAFNQRRKTMRNSLKSLVQDKNLLEEEIFTKRPEQLSTEEFIDLTKKIENLRK
jgi:16S rRNA (adenine1518-N6/adenine1519-N6)-dimethyltransferase